MEVLTISKENLIRQNMTPAAVVPGLSLPYKGEFGFLTKNFLF